MALGRACHHAVRPLSIPHPLERREHVTRSLLARSAPLPPSDRAELVELLAAGFPRRLPERIAVRETMALVIGSGLRKGEIAFDDAREHLRTATDVLRALFV